MTISLHSTATPRTVPADLGAKLDALKEARAAGETVTELLNFDGGQFEGVQFTGALQDTSFREARFTNCDFGQVDLKNARFHKAVFRECRFAEEVDLKLAQFQGATFRRCSFAAKVDLKEADFTGASLSRINLQRVENLSEHRLGAADLSYAKLPENVEKLTGVQSVRDISASAEKILFGLLATCATVAVLSLLLPHATFFRPSAGITLPVLGISVPGRLFYYLSPWLLLIPYSYLLSTLLKLWSGLRGAPAILPNGRYVFREIPSYPNFCALPFAHGWPIFTAAAKPRAEEGGVPSAGNDDDREDEELDRGVAWERNRHVAGVKWDYLLVLAAVWLAVPITVGWLWLRYLAIHDPLGTLIQITAVATASFMSLRSFDSMLTLLTRGILWWDTSARRPAPHRVVRAFFVFPELGHLAATDETEEARSKADASSEGRHRQVVLRGTLVVVCLLAIVSFSAIESGGCTTELSRYAKERGACYWAAADLHHAALDSVVLHGLNLRRAFLVQSGLQRADLEDVHAEGAAFSGAHMEHAVLKDSWLASTIFWESRLDSANLKEARLQGADFRGANLQGAQLQGANLAGADLTGANLAGAVLCGVKLVDENGTARVTPEQLHSAWGQDRLASTPFKQDSGSVRPWPLEEVISGPAYLDESQQAEYGRWREAELQVERLKTAVGDSLRNSSTLSRAWLRSAVRAIDVSMGQGTQRDQLHAIALLDDQVPLRSDRIAPRRAYAALDRFFGKVQAKARNHCVFVPRTSSSSGLWDTLQTPPGEGDPVLPRTAMK